MKIILASQSPRRAAILDLAKIEYDIIKSNFEEKINSNLNLEEQSKELAYGKALDVFNNTQGDRVIIGADTFVVKNDKIYGKPINRTNAIKMLHEIQGGVHSVYTSLAVLIESKGEYKEYKEVVKTNIEVCNMSDDEIIEYVDKEKTYDKAGAYAIQGIGRDLVEKYEGSLNNIIGLPTEKLEEILGEINGMED